MQRKVRGKKEKVRELPVIEAVIATAMDRDILKRTVEEEARKLLVKGKVVVVSTITELPDPILGFLSGEVINVTQTISHVMAYGKVLPARYQSTISPDVELVLGAPPGGAMPPVGEDMKTRLDSLYEAMVSESKKVGFSLIFVGLLYSPWLAPSIKFADRLIFTGSGSTEELLGTARYLAAFASKYSDKKFSEVIIRMVHGRRESVVLAMEPFLANFPQIKSVIKIEAGTPLELEAPEVEEERGGEEFLDLTGL